MRNGRPAWNPSFNSPMKPSTLNSGHGLPRVFRMNGERERDQPQTHKPARIVHRPNSSPFLNLPSSSAFAASMPISIPKRAICSSPEKSQSSWNSSEGWW